MSVFPPRPSSQSMRWLPIPALLAMPLGYVVRMIGSSDATPGPMILGGLLLGVGMLASILLQLLSPRLYPTFGALLDERELLVKTKAYMKSGGLIALLATLGCFYMNYALTFGWWTPEHASDWSELGIMMLGWWFGLPVLIAAWQQTPAPMGDEE